MSSKLTSLRSALALGLFALSFQGSVAFGCRDDRCIPEVLEAEENAAIPSWVFEAYDSRTIGESIARRIQLISWPVELFQKIKKTPGVLTDYDFRRQSSIQLYFSTDDLDLILRTGFKNAHEVDEKVGEKLPGYRQAREKTETVAAAVRLEENYVPGRAGAVARVRPKSAVFQVQLPSEMKLIIQGADRFGGLVAVMRDEVMERTSYTPFDSMDLLKGKLDLPERPRLESRALLEGKLLLPTSALSREYYEAMIWGEVDVRDVKEWMVEPGTPAEVIRKLEATGLPIYEYIETRDRNQFRRDRGRKLYAGDPEVASKFAASLARERRAPSGPFRAHRVSKLEKVARLLRARAPLGEILPNIADSSLRFALVRSYASNGDLEALRILTRFAARNLDQFLGYLDLGAIHADVFKYPPLQRLAEGYLNQFMLKDPGSREETVLLRSFGKAQSASAALKNRIISEAKAADRSSVQRLNFLRLEPNEQTIALYKRLLKEAGGKHSGALYGAVASGIRDAEFLRSIIAASRSGNAYVRREAIWSLEEIGTELSPELNKILKAWDVMNQPLSEGEVAVLSRELNALAVAPPAQRNTGSSSTTAVSCMASF